MATVTVRPMTAEEFAQWQDDLARYYAQEKVTAGQWAAEGAVRRAGDEIGALLPEGLSTPRMLILTGVDAEGAAVGRAWVGLDHPRGTPGVAFLHDIEIEADLRGAGLGRALLAAVEDTARAAGVEKLELNVFGHNPRASGLYRSSGYEVVAQLMRKSL